MWKYLLIFAGGAIIGSASTYLITKKKYENQAQKEIEEVRNIYFDKCRRINSINKLNEEKDRLKTAINNGQSIAAQYKPDIDEEPDESADISEDEDDEEDYENEDQWEREKINPVEHPGDPYTITPHDFAYTNRHYDKITLLYYPSQEVLINELEGMEEDVDSTIGEDSLAKFGEFDENVAYVRNDRLGIDYEVILQPKTADYYIED